MSQRPWERTSLSHTRAPFSQGGKLILAEGEEEIKNIPPGAIRLSRKEVLAAAHEISERPEFEKYQKFTSLWPFGCGLATFSTALYMIGITRQRFKLGMYHARIIHYCYGGVLPAIYSPTLMYSQVAEPALIKEEPCRDCLTLRAGLIQVWGGFVWPSFCGIMGAFYYAKRYYTVPLPPLKPRYWREFHKILSKPFVSSWHWILLNIVAQMGFGALIGWNIWNFGQELNVVENYVVKKSKSVEAKQKWMPTREGVEPAKAGADYKAEEANDTLIE